MVYYNIILLTIIIIGLLHTYYCHINKVTNKYSIKQLKGHARQHIKIVNMLSVYIILHILSYYNIGGTFIKEAEYTAFCIFTVLLLLHLIKELKKDVSWIG